ncbi:AMP-binding protein [Streptomyces sp. AD16]|nr:AMP-binding protein [Streptomyces sp. AD16]
MHPPGIRDAGCRHGRIRDQGIGPADAPRRADEWRLDTGGAAGEIRKHFPDASQWSLGGATEASIWSIWHRITGADAALASVPYGKAMRNQRVYVADSQLRPRPQWVPGEICIAGAGVARGYLGDEERTMKSFVVGPGGERVYRTGDLGRLLPSGEIEFLGREDTQVKIGGIASNWATSKLRCWAAPASPTPWSSPRATAVGLAWSLTSCPPRARA